MPGQSVYKILIVITSYSIHYTKLYDKDEHQKIFQAITDLFASDKAIDLLTVPEQLRKNNHLEEVGGVAFLTQLTSRVASAAHIEFHARIVQQKFIRNNFV